MVEFDPEPTSVAEYLRFKPRAGSAIGRLFPSAIGGADEAAGERAGDIVQIEIGIAEASSNLRQDRTHPGCFHTTVLYYAYGFSARPERRGHEIEEVCADGGGQF